MEAEDEAKHSAMHSAEWRFGVAQVSSRGSVETLADLGFGATLVRRSGSGSGSNGEQVEASETDALVLLDEEALFLVDRGQLSVIDRRTREPMTANGLWDAIIRKQPSFPAKYKVYCYFKEKGYVLYISCFLPSFVPLHCREYHFYPSFSLISRRLTFP